MCAPGAGLCRRTTPAFASSVVATGTVLVVKPASPSAAAASASLLPTTLGTAAMFEACATVRLTAPPACSGVPVAGDCESTVPGDCVVETRCVTVPTVRDALVSVASAAVWDWPVTAGTRTGAGPLDTSTVPGSPTCTSVPADGLVALTRPAGAVEFGCVLVVGLKPALRSRATACAALRPSTLISAAVPGPLETTMLTRVPRATLLRGDGVSLDTRPLATVGLAAREGMGVSPARLS